MNNRYYKQSPNYLKEYFDYLSVVKARSDTTIDGYFNDIRVFLRYLKLSHQQASEEDFDNISIADVPLEWLNEVKTGEMCSFLNFTSNSRGNSPRTRARKICSLKQLYLYLTINYDNFNNKTVINLEVPKYRPTVPKHLTKQQSVKLLNSIDSKHRLRDLCIILMFLSCGMRLSELVGLDINDYNEEERSLRLLGKGNKERIVYLNDSCEYVLKKYIDSRKDSSRALFLSNTGNRIHKRRVQQIVGECLERAGLDNLGITTHKLRHTAATLMYENGTDLMVIKELLGHESIATTQIYTHVSNPRLKKACENSPLANYYATDI